MSETTLITGASGFIGTHLADILRQERPEATIVGADRRAAPEGAVEVQDVNLADREAVRRLIDATRPDCIYHLAGVIYSADLEELYRGNVQATVNLLDAVHASGLKPRVIIPGSAAEYGFITPGDLPIAEGQLPNPASPYGLAKTWQSAAARFYATRGVDVQVGRVFNVIGRGMPEGLSIGSFASQLRKIRLGELPPRLEVGNLAPKRDFVDVADVCRAFIVMAAHGQSGDIVNISSGTSISIDHVLRLMIDRSGLDVEVAVDRARFKSADIEDIYGDNSKLIAAGWKMTVPIEESVKQIMDCYLT